MTQTLTTPRAVETSAATATDTSGTTALLACGAVAGPLFLGVAVIQALTRAGFDPRRPLHVAVSLHNSSGSGGIGRLSTWPDG
jgi:hypothetical protein